MATRAQNDPRRKAREGRTGRFQAPLIAGLVAFACLLAVPVALLELVAASVGLSEMLPAFAPPIGWGVRIALALIGGAVAAVLSLGIGGESAGTHEGRNGRMAWSQALGLKSLVRLARGADAETAPVAPPMRRHVPVEAVAEADEVMPFDVLPRHRADLHPDAPPRPPLVASRDLPRMPELTLVESEPVAPPPPAPLVTPIRETTDEARPRPLPRSPEPLSDSDISWMRGLLAEREAEAAAMSVPTPVAAPVPVVVAAHAATPVVAVEPAIQPAPEAPVAPVSDASLLSLVDRFEQGVERRIVLGDAANAQGRVEAALGEPMQVEPTAPEVDDALLAALETLKKLSNGAKGR